MVQGKNKLVIILFLIEFTAGAVLGLLGFWYLTMCALFGCIFMWWAVWYYEVKTC